MSLDQLQRILQDLPAHGACIKDRPARQIWRFEWSGKSYYLKFYPRPGSRLKRLIRGSPAMREFTSMQTLQRAKIRSPRAVALLAGYVLKGVKGDAVLSEGIEPGITLDRYLNDFELQGRHAPDHIDLAAQVVQIVHDLGRQGLGHADLHLGNFLRDDAGRLHLLDAYAIRPGGMKMEHILRLGHSAARYATRGDVRRGWNQLAPGSEIPRANRVSPRIWRKFISLIGGGNRYFARVESQGWRGAAFCHWKYPARWSPASQLQIDPVQWEQAWPALLEKMETGALERVKTSRSGDVYAGEVTLAGRRIEVILKRPRRKFWWRYVNEIGRGARAWRAWKKSWALITRNIPTAWPLLIMERKVLGYTVDQVIVCEKVHGEMLATIDLDAMSTAGRQTMFRRCGKMLRRIELTGLVHFDPKSSNWIIQPDDVSGPTPVLVDVDGVRFYRWDTFGVRRLLASMREHPKYTPADSLALCRGYAPFSRMMSEGEEAV